MPYYKDENEKITYIGNPDLNPDLIAGKTLIGETPTPTNAISASDLEPTTGLPYKNPNPITPIDTSGLSVDLTPSQKKEQTATEELQGLLGQLGGESAYRTQIGTDIAGLEKTKTEQGIIVQNLQLEAQRLANEYAGVQDVVTAESIGRRGMAGVRQLTSTEQRNIAIQQRGIASQALTAYAAYNTAAGNLQVAQDAINRAVLAKFDPIREEISIKKQNLELLKGSPLATAEEKAQAGAQQKKLDADKKKLDEQQGFYENIQSLYVQVAATPGISVATVSAIKKILAKDELTIDDVAEVNRLATEAGIGVEAPDLLSVAEAKSLGVPYGTTREQATRMGITPSGGGDEDNYNTYSMNLNKVGIPVASLNQNGTMSATYKKRVIDALPDIEGTTKTEIADWLWGTIIEGNTFEEIRQEIRSAGADPAILDIFVQELQA